MKVQRTCMRDHVRDVIISRILDGHYPPGTRLKELALAAECNVSQAPVREALRELEVLGLVQSERYRGTRVRETDSDELRQAYELRTLLEERAAQLAVPCAPAVIAELEQHLKRMRHAVRKKDNAEHADAAIRFHRRLIEASGNRAFVTAWDSLHWEVRTRIAVQRARHAGIDFESFMDAHEQVLDALRSGDGIRAGQVIRDLMERVVTQVFPQSGTAPAPAPGKARA